MTVRRARVSSARPRATSPLLAACACILLVSAQSLAEGLRARGWVGIAMGPTDEGLGVRVDHVIHGSPADKAGLRPDDHITHVDGVAVATSRDVVRLIGVHAAGDAVRITVAHSGRPFQLDVVLAEYPSVDSMLRMDHVGSPAPAWERLELTTGFPSSVAGLRGHVIVVDFWATWCGPCRELAPILSGWQSRYGAQGLNVLGITTDSLEAATSYRERLDLRYPMASDPEAKTSLAYGVSALPTLFVIDKRGVVRDVAVGVDPGQDARIESLVRTLLAEPVANP